MTVTTLHQSVAKALYAKFKSDQTTGSPYALTGGRWYAEFGREEATRPYIVVEQIGSDEDDTFDTDADRVSIMLWVVTGPDNGIADAVAILDALRTLFDHAALTFSDGSYTQYYTIDVRPGSINGPDWTDGLIVAGQPYTVIVQEQ